LSERKEGRERTGTYVLDRSRDELVERKERIRPDARHVPQLLLIRLLIDLAIEQLLSELEHVLVVVLRRVVACVDDGYGSGETEVDADGVQTLVAVGGGEVGSELLESE
jgi:hypothetical protein